MPLDEKLLAAIVKAGESVNGAKSVDDAGGGEVTAVPKRLRSESALTPREMQARLRAGRTIDEVAAEAGVDHEWVARFAVPILAEQAQVVELARGLTYAKPRLGESTDPLGSSVMQNLSDRGIFMPDDVANSSWSAFQLHDSVWMVRFRYRSRSRDQEAQWEIDVPAGRLRARNRQASDLGYVGPDRWVAEEDAEDDGPEVAPPARAVRRAPAPPARRPAKAAPPARRPAKAAQPARRPAKATQPARQAVKATPPARRPAKAAPPARRPAKAAQPARRAAKATQAPARPVKSTMPKNVAAAKRAVAQKAAGRSATRPPAATKAATRRRPTKAVPAPDAGPTAGSGGVRMAVAQVSAARVAASMATADRQPWKAAAGRPPVQPAPPRDRRREVTPAASPFQPRPLPPPGSEPPERRPRTITVATSTAGSSAAVSLPKRRRPSQDAAGTPAAERPKRRRLRSR